LRSRCLYTKLPLRFILFGLGALPIRVAAAQSFSCVPTSASQSIRLRDYVVGLTGGDATLSKKRHLYHLPQVSSSSVSVVTQSKTCADAAKAYHSAVRVAGNPQISRMVIVIKVGNTNYVVLDPGEREGEYQVTVIFDRNFQALAAFNS